MNTSAVNTIENDIHRVFVTADEKIAGIVSALDILRKLPMSKNKKQGHA